MKMTKQNESISNEEKTELEVRSKFFQTRKSFLTDLYEEKDKVAVVHVCVAVIIGFFGHIAIGDIFYNTGNQFGFKLIFASFPNFGTFIVSWCVVFLSSLVLFLAFQVWARLRIYLVPKSMPLKLLDTVSLIAFPCYWFGVFTFSSYLTLTGRVINLCSVSLHAETFRLFAKTYACVRDSLPKILKNKLKSDKRPYFPTFSNFLYFLFAPTLIYNDSYPRFKTPIRWSFVAEWLIHLIVSIILYSCVVETVIMPDLRNYKNLHLMDLIAMSFKYHFVVTFLIILTFYIILHCIQNIFAEILGFPYRVFYTNWWCSTDFMQYFSKWNVLVRDWFYIYVYLDVYKNLTKNNKFLAKYAVFLLSALFHEMLASITGGYCLPVVFLEYFILVAVVPIIKIKNNRCANVFFWFSVSMGYVVVMIVHILETLARIKCPIENETILTFFTPRMFSCYK